MKSVCEILLQRRSIRNFVPDFKIPKEDIEKIVEASLNSPTAINLQEDDLIVLTNKEKLAKINELVFPQTGEKFIEFFKKRQEDYGTICPITYDCSALFIIVTNERAGPKWGPVDAGIFSMAIMTAAESLGYGSVALGVIAGKGVEQLLGIEKGEIVLGVAVGKPMEKVNIKPKENLRKVTYIE